MLTLNSGFVMNDYPVLTEILSTSTMTLATVSPGGEPHAAPVYFAADEALDCYFFSDVHSRHSRDLSRDPHAAAALYPDCRDWQEIRGLQLRGTVEPVPDGDAWERAWRIYLEKFPFVSGLGEAVSRGQLYVFSPDWLRLVDNRQGFGYKREWRRESAATGDRWMSLETGN